MTDSRDLRFHLARCIQEFLLKSSMSSDELLTLVNARLPEGAKPMGRKTMDRLMLGWMLPHGRYLKPLADAMGVRPKDLIPTAKGEDA